MDHLKKLLDILKRERVNVAIYKKCSEYVDELDDDDLYVGKLHSYVKALIVDDFLKLSEKGQKDTLSLLSCGFIDPKYVCIAIRNINMLFVDSGSLMYPPRRTFLRGLEQYKDDPILDEDLISNDELIKRIICKRNHIYPIDDIEKGKYSLIHNYRLDESEITEIKKVTYITDILIRRVHELYDEDQGEFNKTVCNYDAIEDEAIRKLIPHTYRKNPPVQILLSNGSIVDYYKGDIKIKPYRMMDFINLVKLVYVKKRHESSLMEEYEPEILEERNSEMEYLEERLCLTEEEKERLEKLRELYLFKRQIKDIVDEVSEEIDGLDQVYSERMKDMSKEKVDMMDSLVLKYNL